MNSYREYAASFTLPGNRSHLDIGLKEALFGLYDNSQLVRTPGGHTFVHPGEEVIRMILTDILLAGDTPFSPFSAPVLYAFTTDVLRTGSDPLTDQWETLMEADPFVRLKTGGLLYHPSTRPDEEGFAFSFSVLSGLTSAVHRFFEKSMGELAMEEDEIQPFPVLVQQYYARLPLEEKAAVQALSNLQGSGIVLPLLAILREIDPVDYCKGLIALKMIPAGTFRDALSDLAQVLAFTSLFVERNVTVKPLQELIREGEGDMLEFKSTLRWDIRAGKTNPAIERSCLKTIAAFLNSGGGILLVGVRDDGSAEGIESDKFANDDKFLLHLWTLIRNCLGRNISPCIRTRMEKLEEKTICRVTCSPSAQPVFLRQAGFDEELFIRVGPSSNALDISEALKYIRDHFGVR